GQIVEEHRAAQPPPAPTKVVVTPKAVDDGGFTVEPDPEEPGGFIVRGAKPERWVRQTNFANDEAVGYLAERLYRLGVEKELRSGQVVEEHRAAQPPPAPTKVVVTPKAVDDGGFTVEPDPEEPGGFIVRGAKPERWVRQTNFANDEAVGYLAERLYRLGVEKEL